MIRLASPDVRDSDIENCVNVLKSGHLVQGINVRELEDELCQFTQLQSAAVVTSGTAALHLVLKALGIHEGDTVIVPAFTFPATANVVESLGADVLLADVSLDSYVVTAESVEKVINDNKNCLIKAIIVVHEFGFPVNMLDIRTVADRYGLILIEDAACALGSIVDGRHVGYYSHAACFSFHPRKAITTGEGGAVLSQDDQLVNTIKKIRNHGISTEGGILDFEFSGLNYRLTDFQAALALGQLKRFEKEILKRKNLVEKYCNGLSELTNVFLPLMHNGHSWQSFMILLNKAKDRDKLIKCLRESEIETNVGAYALHMLTYYKKKYSFIDEDYPNSYRLYRSGLVLPLYGKLSEKEVDYVISTLSRLLRDV